MKNMDNHLEKLNGEMDRFIRSQAEAEVRRLMEKYPQSELQRQAAG